ncbi:MAG: hypothetical protein ACE5OP_04880 [Candidatus Glassbacteria bacterium]
MAILTENARNPLTTGADDPSIIIEQSRLYFLHDIAGRFSERANP